MNQYIYKAKVLDVYDADTMTLLIDVGFSIYIKEKVRLVGIDCPEIRTKNAKEKKLGLEARDWVRKLVMDKTIKINTEKGTGKFGRYLVEVYLDTGSHLNSMLVTEGYAKHYDGGKREKWFV